MKISLSDYEPFSVAHAAGSIKAGIKRSLRVADAPGIDKILDQIIKLTKIIDELEQKKSDIEPADKDAFRTKMLDFIGRADRAIERLVNI